MYTRMMCAVTCVLMDAVLLLIVSLQMEDIKLPMRRGRMEDIGDEEVCTNALLKFLRNVQVNS